MRSDLASLRSQLGAKLQSLPATSPVPLLLAALLRDGIVVMTDAVSATTADACMEEMHPYLAEQPYGADAFLGAKTLRVGAVIGRSPASWEMAAHRTVLELCDAVLGCQLLSMTPAQLEESLQAGSAMHPWQLHVSQLIHVGAGEAEQALHRDQPWPMRLPPHWETGLSTMWALSDFTEEIGATRVVLGSHEWDGMAPPSGHPPQWVSATMPKGSVAIYLGRTLHGAGQNRSKETDRA